MPRWRVDVPGEIVKARLPLRSLEARLRAAWLEKDERAIRLLRIAWREAKTMASRRIVYLRRLARRRKTT
jgi:hypothetical protein